MTEQELLEDFWELNKKYPDYVNCVRFDHASPAFHDIEECKKNFLLRLKNIAEKGIKETNERLERAQENGEDLNPLYSLRGRIRACQFPDISKAQSVDEIEGFFPPLLKRFL